MDVEFDHVAFASADVRGWERFFGEELGAGWVFSGKAAEFSTIELRFAASLPKVEIISPRGQGFISRFLEKHGPGVHHITFVTDDLEQCAHELRRHGLEPWLTDLAGDTWHQIILHPRHGWGTVIQIGSVVGAPFVGPAPPGFVSSTPRAEVATVVLPMSAFSDAQVLFRNVLSGREAAKTADWQEYAWDRGGRLRVAHVPGQNGDHPKKPYVEIAVSPPCGSDELRRLEVLGALAAGPHAIHMFARSDGCKPRVGSTHPFGCTLLDLAARTR